MCIPGAVGGETQEISTTALPYPCPALPYPPPCPRGQVIKRFNKNSKLIIACGDGLRSLVACKLLQDEGCRDVVWVEAGLLTCESEPAMKSVGTQVDVGYKRAGLDLGLIWANAVDKFTGTTNKNYS